jgi:PIN domain nuclease of toxin-antitoxin system
MWLAARQMKKLTREAVQAIDASDLLISPMVLLELEYLYEIRRLARPSLAILDQLQRQIGLKVSDYSFAAVAQSALFETWTREPFDRIIVAQARSDGFSGLISADEKIRQNYSRTIW